MCILFVYLRKRTAGKFKVVLAANRDEFYARPAKAANYWLENSSLLGGRDMEPGREGGTWLAMNKISGRIGVLLNITTPGFSKDKKGRGGIVSDHIASEESCLDYCKRLNEDADAYNAFNFVAVEASKASPFVTYYCSNDGNMFLLESDEFLGFGNTPYATPYQKVQNGLPQFRQIVENFLKDENEDLMTQEILKLMKSEAKHWPDHELDTRASSFREDIRKGLSSIFVSVPAVKYGTRTHTIITVDNDNNCKFREWTMQEPIQTAKDAEWIHSDFEFKLHESDSTR